MSTHSMQVSLGVLLGTTLLGQFGCDGQVTAPPGEITLSSLHFTPTEVRLGEPVALVATPGPGESVTTQPVLLTTSSGAEAQALVSPWDSLSDAELTATIAVWDGRVFIGFKEADAVRGVDETGHSTTSRETLDRMKQWVREQGIAITREYTLTPTVTASMQPDEELVATVRHHQNVDYLEPVTVGEYLGGATGGSAPVLVAVIPTSAGQGGTIRLHVGDQVTAEYRQPDGSLLRAVASVQP